MHPREGGSSALQASAIDTCTGGEDRHGPSIPRRCGAAPPSLPVGRTGIRLALLLLHGLLGHSPAARGPPPPRRRCQARGRATVRPCSACSRAAPRAGSTSPLRRTASRLRGVRRGGAPRGADAARAVRSTARALLARRHLQVVAPAGTPARTTRRAHARRPPRLPSPRAPPRPPACCCSPRTHRQLHCRR